MAGLGKPSGADRGPQAPDPEVGRDRPSVV